MIKNNEEISYNKIYIIGPVGSGKTTLSKVLSEKYNIKNYELDKVVWDDDNGNIKRTDEEISELFNKIIDNDSWIIEDVGRKKFIDGIKKADITYYIDLPKITIYKRCIKRWIKQKAGKEKYNYKPTIKGLFEMLKWAKQDFKNKGEKIKRIIDNSKEYKILKDEDIKNIIKLTKGKNNE
ncbi:MAG: AAA family ATPase [Clostridia bacterium]|nr:AAA family ATPase [Clostridia bacterium]